MALTPYYLSLTSGAIHTKGAYVEGVASTPYASSRMHVLIRNCNASRFYLIDIATGGSGTETVIVANIPLATNTDGFGGIPFVVNVDIPMGTRISARCQCATASQVMFMDIVLEDRALGSLSNPVTYGTVDLPVTRGQQIDPGTTISTKGSYFEISSSTSARIDALLICITSDYQGSPITSYIDWRMDIATGGSGTETIVIPDVGIIVNANNDVVAPSIRYLPVSIPASTRLSVRASCSVTTAGQRIFRVLLIGMQESVSSSLLVAESIQFSVVRPE